MAYDLHTHTSASDGTYSPTALVNKAVYMGLRGLAITDHDTVGGIEEAEKAARLLPCTVIPGVELSTDWCDEEIHVLGYFIDCHQKSLLSVLDMLEAERWQRGQKMVRKLKELGMDISWAHVSSLAGFGVVGRPHVAQVMVSRGYVADVREAFADYLSKGKPGYVCRAKLSPIQAIQVIRDAGGVAVLAHPGLLKNAGSIETILSFGFDGIEVNYPQHDQQQVRRLTSLASVYKLAITGGSDFHGEIRSHNKLGACAVSEAMVKALKKKREGN